MNECLNDTCYDHLLPDTCYDYGHYLLAQICFKKTEILQFVFCHKCVISSMCLYCLLVVFARLYQQKSSASGVSLSKRFEKSLPSALRILLLNIIEYIYIYMWGTQQNYFLSAKICRHLAPPPRARFSRGMTSRSRAAATG